MNTLVVNPMVEKMDFSSNEALNMLRENVQMGGYNYKVLAITSALPNEGKSYIAFGLAHSLANLGKKTVFVDCDIRNSVIKKKYGILDKTVGLSEYLCGQCTQEDIVYNTTTENMDMIFSGKKSPKPSELLSGEQFPQLLDILRKNYDYIILDTPPVNVVVDATIVAKKADTAILVVRSCYTDRYDAIQMKKQLEMSNIPILGVVINLYNTHKSSYGKYGYGKYGYGKYGYGKYGYGKYGYGDGYGEEKEHTAVQNSVWKKLIKKIQKNDTKHKKH